MENSRTPWPEDPTHKKWQSLEVSQKILGEVEEGRGVSIPTTWARECARRVCNMRDVLRESWVGLGDTVDWLLAALIARENALLLGPPGVAKTEIATRVFELLGLKKAEAQQDIDLQPIGEKGSPVQWWSDRRVEARQNHKYFHYLLSRFTQPEELFGPIEISLLRQGILARVNFGLLTGPGVRAAFLDELMKASSSILNTLLTLTQERQYFNWGGMVQSDLIMFIGASNELPGGFGSGSFGVGSGAEDFQTLYAFLDRFPIRLLVPMASGTSTALPRDSDLARATWQAIAREAAKFTTGARFLHTRSDMPGINDILLLGRVCLEQATGLQGLFRSNDLDKFWDALIGTAAALQVNGTGTSPGAITWTISPRKVGALYKIALAHALVRDNAFANGADVVTELGAPDLHVFALIWDSPLARQDLFVQTMTSVNRYFG